MRVPQLGQIGNRNDRAPVHQTAFVGQTAMDGQGVNDHHLLCEHLLAAGNVRVQRIFVCRQVRQRKGG